MKCAFCERGRELEKRVFYDRGNWYAFLGAPPNAVGHAILALKKSGAECPAGLLRSHLTGFDVALGDVVDTLQQHYQPKDVLVASLRALDPHVHWHLIPRWDEQEEEWRGRSRLERGHLFEFLADIDQVAQSKAIDERRERGWSNDEQRDHFTQTVRPVVAALRALTGYTPR